MEVAENHTFLSGLIVCFIINAENIIIFIFVLSPIRFFIIFWINYFNLEVIKLFFSFLLFSNNITNVLNHIRL